MWSGPDRQGDFALHRNQSLELATGQWILVLDVNEELKLASVARRRPLLVRLELAGADALFIEILHLATDDDHGL